MPKYERPTAEEVRVMRHTLGWTQKNLASELGVSIVTVRGWERGRRRMPAPTWRLFQLVYDCHHFEIEFMPPGVAS